MPSSDPSIRSPLDNSLSLRAVQCSKYGTHSSPYYFCMRCNEMFCGNCWDKQMNHQTPESGHEQTIPNDATIVYSILNIRYDEWPLLRAAHSRGGSLIGDNGEWFGVRPKNEAGDYSLVESPAYNLFVDSFETPTSTMYPALVSFVGATGSGKSTLISLLSKFSTPFFTNDFQIPDVGDLGSRQPTSSNVHLYADPQTYGTKNPILYAECEAMVWDGIPTKMRYPLPHAFQIPELRSQNIIWSKMPRNAGAWTRKEITGILFSRVLYIFSDVVIFPFIGSRLDDPIIQLVKWAHRATIQSYNKPVLPSAIIVFINRDDQVNLREYDLSAASKLFIEQRCLQDISQDKTLKPYIRCWETNGQRIVSAKDLLSCYYASVSVVHVPSGHRPTIMHQQIDKLHDRIRQLCSHSREQRAAAWMKWNVVTFPLFVRKAFTHFASKYETPFNFSDAWVDVKQFSPDFNRSIFNLARMARGHRDLSRAGMDLWARLGRFVGSCLFLNCVRAKQADCRVTANIWMQCDRAAEQYWMKFWPCDYTIQGRQQCANAPWGHPHHQRGKTVKPGAHLAGHSLRDLQDEFRGLISKVFDELQLRLKHLSDSHERLKEASTIHLRRTRRFYKSIGGIDKLVSHLPCLVCLDGVPEHSLPCGHVICRECAKATGDSTPGGFVVLQSCPLQNHREEDWPRGLAEKYPPSSVTYPSYTGREL